MKCARCSAEVPGQAQFCMKCGTPVAAGRPGPTVTIAHNSHARAAAAPAGSSKTGKIVALSALVVVLCAAAIFGIQNLLARNAAAANAGHLTDLNGHALDGSGLLDKNGRIGDTGNLTDAKGKVEPGPADPVDVIDYLKHVRQIERDRLTLAKAQLAQALTWSSQLTAQNLTAEMGENPEAAHKTTYGNLQSSISQWSTQWEGLSQKFNAYPKPVPQSCTTLRDRYLDALGKTASSMVTVGNSFARAMSGDAGSAIQALTDMQGKASGEIDAACDKADEELGAVCAKYNLHKDFDIKADGGASNPFGVGR